jgi:hypothetical protein
MPSVPALSGTKLKNLCDKNAAKKLLHNYNFGQFGRLAPAGPKVTSKLAQLN